MRNVAQVEFAPGAKRSLTFVLCIATAPVTATATADVLMFGDNGKVTARGWIFHSTQAAAQLGLSEATTPVSARETEVLAPAPSEVRALIRNMAKLHSPNRALSQAKIEPAGWERLFTEIIRAESGFNPKAVSPKGAIGLAQLMPGTAKELGVDPHQPKANLDGGARYFLAQLQRFKKVELALAAYNAGPHRVVEYGGIPPFTETKSYVAKIMARWRR